MRRAASRRLSLSLLVSVLAHGVALYLLQDATGKSQVAVAAPLRVVLQGQPHGRPVPKLIQQTPERSRPGNLPPAPAKAEPPPAPMVEEAPALIPLPEENTYLDPDKVDQMASATDVPDLPVPPDARTPNGRLQIKILINEWGAADGVEVEDTTLPDDYVAALVETFYKAAYSPALVGGNTVKSWRRIEIVYGENEPLPPPPPPNRTQRSG